ncbi:MBL fold metallo-hydrolase [Paenibacillus sp. Soil724D2]|uniref:MBL fold metallo-hydrolase n=1 Tax=Paenibacillus sp. (strain Soil724D2) TaxID=1736392 RepID=UPI0007161BB5|nr:MBL fold metallo-hydrolase [Paenibacillus sp. Soil724D2]KRE34093.1 hypothetical protein ASG85_11980 [Paenibacillus sp. Soil724D2]
MIELSKNLFLYQDTCHVYVVKNGTKAVLIDFGSGEVLDRLTEIGVDQVCAVLMTHHHRDQGQGLARASEAGIPIWVPHTEQELFSNIDAHWQAREVFNNYNVRQDRYSLLEQVAIAGALKDYESYEFAGYGFKVVPTPGHTIGSVSFLAWIDGRHVAFTGDLIAGPGKMWSLAATQWSYNGGEGLPATVASLLDLQERAPDWLLPSHGERMERPSEAIGILITRLQELMQYRQQNPRLLLLREQPFEEVTPHLLRSRMSMSNYYVLLSKSGKALFFDFGYDFLTGIPVGSDRASRRPWLYTLATLKKQYGITQVDAVVPTHYHDDHVAGINLLRDNEGTKVWASETFADVLRQPSYYDLPCLWFDAIPVDRELSIGASIQWEEYEFTLHPLPGHTLYAVAISLMVDDKHVLVSGDQYQGGEGLLWNYVYQNRFRIQDYVDSAALYEALHPDVILTGHWEPLWVQPGYFAELAARGNALERLHRELLPLNEVDFGAEGIGGRLSPYQTHTQVGEKFTMQVEVKNPFAREALAEVRLVVPPGWRADPEQASLQLAAKATETIEFCVTPSGPPVRRARVAVELTVEGRRFGQQAEALVTVQ